MGSFKVLPNLHSFPTVLWSKSLPSVRKLIIKFSNPYEKLYINRNQRCLNTSRSWQKFSACVGPKNKVQQEGLCTLAIVHQGQTAHCRSRNTEGPWCTDLRETWNKELRGTKVLTVVLCGNQWRYKIKVEEHSSVVVMLHEELYNQ